MSSKINYPSVSQALLAEVVNRIRATGDPLKVVLFGSQARGDTHPESDLDLLVVEESDLPRYKRSPRYYKALVGVFPAKDITVWTPTEIQEWSAVPNAFITMVLREGKVLYEKPA
ncbi:MAG: nucleotidyltransferase domain-containing protein [Leptolyngbyaceae cyanobacterium]